MKTLRNLTMSLIVLAGVMSQSLFAQEDRNIAEWNLSSSKIAINGYDPVSYFPEGGSKAKKGSESLEIEFEGVLYRFSSQENLDTFLSNTQKYEPAHGIWCSTAMAFGQKIIINPKKFVVSGNRLFLFSTLNGADGKTTWLKDAAKLERRADRRWKSFSGESARK